MKRPFVGLFSSSGCFVGFPLLGLTVALAFLLSYSGSNGGDDPYRLRSGHVLLHPDDEEKVVTTEEDRSRQRRQPQHRRKTVENNSNNPPNILLFIVDDLGWNQVGYHARAAGNSEIDTPHMDAAARGGIELDRGYVTPWCGPSRAAILTGRTNVYNANVSNGIHNFDGSIGYVSGLPPGTQTIANAFKRHGRAIGRPYRAYMDGKWGIGVSV
jgi:Sulfatase